MREACNDTCFCLSLQSDGEFVLKPGHPYYAQVQCQLLATKADYCDFVVWTTVDFLVVRVEPDAAFLQRAEEKAKAFFQRVVLPEMVAKHFTNIHTASTSVIVTPDSQTQHLTRTSERMPLSPQKSNPPPKRTKRVICSKGKPRRKVSVWCLCRKPESGDMVACDSENCKVQWYHTACVGLDHLPGKDDAWFCPACLDMSL